MMLSSIINNSGKKQDNIINKSTRIKFLIVKNKNGTGLTDENIVTPHRRQTIILFNILFKPSNLKYVMNHK